MKTIKILSFVSVFAVLLSGCAESWLESQPTGGVLTQEQFDELGGATIEGQVLGLYSLLDPGSSDHSSFGQKTIDIVTDLIASDMAMTNRAYGWYVTDAQLTSTQMGSGRNYEFWMYHYFLIKNCNITLKRIVAQPNFDTDKALMSYHAQALAMRAYAYMGLYNLYLPSLRMCADKDTYEALRAFPVYVESSRVDSARGPESVKGVQDRIISDLTLAIQKFDDVKFKRADKLYMDANVAKALLAKFYLEIGEYQKSYDLAYEVIDKSGASVISYDEVLTDGFNDYTSNSWLWGCNILPVNKGGLRSFWGHMDIYTYSYAQAGASKAIDKSFFDGDVKNHKGDIREKWFQRGSLVPYSKFFTEKCDRDIVAQLDTATDKALIAELQAIIFENLDRDWLSDIVYMRIEEMLLVAAEAATENDQLADARVELKSLVSQRYNGTDLTDRLAAIDAMDKAALLEEIKYNWRIEFWGEGKSLQTMKRFVYSVTRGSNHFHKPTNAITPNSGIFQIPSSEINANPGAWYVE